MRTIFKCKMKKPLVAYQQRIFSWGGDFFETHVYSRFHFLCILVLSSGISCLNCFSLSLLDISSGINKKGKTGEKTNKRLVWFCKVVTSQSQGVECFSCFDIPWIDLGYLNISKISRAWLITCLCRNSFMFSWQNRSFKTTWYTLKWFNGVIRGLRYR